MSSVLDRCVAVLMVALAAAAVFVVSALAGCERADESQEAEPAAAAAAPRKSFFPDLAEIERFRAEGPEPTLRRIAAVDYWLHYRLMQDSGIEEALGGEAQAIAALKALGEAYERRARELHEEVPRMIRTDFTGEGMRSGFAGMSLGSFVGLLTGGLTRSAVSRMSDKELKDISDAGAVRHEGQGGNHEMTIGADGSLTQSTEFDVQEDGLHGKVKMKMRMDACPDADGRVTMEIDVDSQMNVTAKPGTGGYIKSNFRYERWLNDDAHLIDTPDGGASQLHINIGGIENLRSQGGELTVGHDRNGNEIFRHHGEHGYSIFRPEEGKRTQELVRNTELLQTLMAELLLRGIGGNGTPWENGRCVDLQVKSNPAKRSALKPGTRFDLEASPRVKADGSAAGGTVTATLTGGATLQPAEGKVKADAKYAYVGPEEKEKSASIAFEARSKRGVGRASLEFDTRVARAYRIEGGADEFHGTGVVCNLEEQFFVEGSGVTVRFEPSSGQGGRYSYSGKMSGFEVFGHGTYTVNGGETASSITATGPGSVRTPMGVHTNTGTEQYTLTPLDVCPDG